MVLLLYGAWIGGPYLHSVVVRDAAVTTWLHVVAAPIAGQLDESALPPDGTVAAEGMLATITDPLADRTAEARAEGELAAAEARAKQVNQLAVERRAQFAAYAEAFMRDLDLRIESQTARSGYIAQRLATEKAEAARYAALRAGGNVSSSQADSAVSRVAAMEVERVEADDALQRTKSRRENAAHGVFLADDGQEADWAARFDPRRLAEDELVAGHTLATARAVAEAAREAFSHRHAVVLSAPAKSIVWRRFAAPGSTVTVGTPVAAWIDPKVLLVDVPVSDVTASLLRPGSSARVIIEGEQAARDGVVLFTRGSAGVLDDRELAAVAKGRHSGVAQAIVRLDPSAVDRSVVGRAAFVEFPKVGLVSVLRTRLRW